MDKRVEEAFSNIDSILGQVNLSRVGHMTLLENLKLIKERVDLSYELQKEAKKKKTGK